MISSDEGVEIVVLDNLVNNVSANLKLYLIRRFVAFHPSIEMVRKWVSQRWKLKGSGIFCFKFMAI